MRYCSNCGVPMSDTSKFCSSCGTKFEVFVPSPQEMQQQYQQQQTAPPPQYRQPVASPPPVMYQQPARPFVEGERMSQSSAAHQYQHSEKTILLFIMCIVMGVLVCFLIVFDINLKLDKWRYPKKVFFFEVNAESVRFFRDAFVILCILGVIDMVIKCVLINKCYIVIDKERVYGIGLPKRFAFSNIEFNCGFDEIKEFYYYKPNKRLTIKPYRGNACVFFVDSAAYRRLVKYSEIYTRQRRNGSC